MKAVVKVKAGVGAILTDMPIPHIGKDELLVKVKVAAICGTDLHIYQWNAWAQGRIKKLPLIMGHEFAGEVIEVGSNVERVKIGDSVSAETHIYCGNCYHCLTGQREICENIRILGIDRNGAFAEYVAIPENVAWVNPEGLSPEIAAIQEPLGSATDAVLAEGITGKTVAVTGAGPMGLLAIGVARAAGATKIIVSDLSDYRLDIARRMGADIVVNAATEDLKTIVMDETNGIGVDVGLEMSGNGLALNDLLKVITAGGRISLLGLFNSNVSIDLNNLIFKKIRVYGITGRKIFQTWATVSRLLRSKRLDVTPVITHKFPLTDFEKGMKLMKSGSSGKVILTM